LPKATLDSFVDVSGEEIKDNRLPFSSKWNIAAQADYVVDLSSGQLNLHIDADYQSEFYFDQNQNSFVKQNDLFFGMLAWHGKWLIGLWGHGLKT
jgi:iron complex outermembrane receptor protein